MTIWKAFLRKKPGYNLVSTFEDAKCGLCCLFFTAKGLMRAAGCLKIHKRVIFRHDLVVTKCKINLAIFASRDLRCAILCCWQNKLIFFAAMIIFFTENIYSSGKCNAVGCHGALE